LNENSVEPVKWRGTTASGYAVLFNRWTSIGDLFLERIAHGALTKTLRDSPDVRALWDHETSLVLGRTTARTLRLNVDSKGLRFDLDLDPRNPTAQMALSAVERGDVTGCSFGLRVTSQTWEDDGPLPERTINELELIEVSLCPFPAYTETSVAIRSPALDYAYRRARFEQKARGISG